MKQRRIKELQVMHYENGGTVNYTPSRAEEYAPVLAQAEAHQDLRFHATVNNAETMIILPWESVIGVYATYETADVTAPTDTICGGEVGTLELTPKAESEIIVGVYYVKTGDCMLDLPMFAEVIKSVVYNGEEIPLADWSNLNVTINGVKADGYNAGVQIPHECGDDSIVAGGTYPVTYVASYNGATASVTVDLQITVG